MQVPCPESSEIIDDFRLSTAPHIKAGATDMTISMQATAEVEEEPLFSNSFLLRALVYLGVMATLTLTLVFGGHWLGKRINLAGHTDSRDIMTIDIGRDRLKLPANVIRFDTQRHSGTAERVDLYLSWPTMDGYSREESARFNNLSQSRSLIFLQITQSVMSRDMSGRVQPIYSHYFDGAPEAFGNGLTLHRFKPEAGYQDDVLLTASREGNTEYAVRCILPGPDTGATAGDCQRDIVLGNDLSVLYRFSSNLLPQWRELDRAVADYIGDRVSQPSGTHR